VESTANQVVSNRFCNKQQGQWTQHGAPWVAPHDGALSPGDAGPAAAVDGMSLVVGQGYDTVYAPDRVYILIKLPPEPHTFKVVIGWRDHDNRGNE
jgi:hypothetical protein